MEQSWIEELSCAMLENFPDFEMFQFHGGANVKSAVEVKFVLKRKSIRLVD